MPPSQPKWDDSELLTNHGSLLLPCFLPDATRAVVRALGADDLRKCGVQGLVVNTFHLLHTPGTTAVSAMGGIHSFMGWDAPILTDSGGFQVLSLMGHSSSLASITEKGFRYRPPGQKGKRTLTPRKCIRSQSELGSDILVCLDHCTRPDAPYEQQRASVENTVGWALESRKEFDRIYERSGDRRPLLFAVIQGGNDLELRRECAERLFEIGFDGYGFGGWPITRSGRMVEMVQAVADLIPSQYPKWALGIGKPEHVVRCVELGYGLFDCSLPTRDARHGRLFVFSDSLKKLPTPDGEFYQCLYPLDERHHRARQPVDPHCDCLCCTSYSRGYLHHLFHVRDALAHRLATIHNLRFYSRLMEHLRLRKE